MRAKTRAVAAAAGAALVVVPLTGAAAAALVTTEPLETDTGVDVASAYTADVAAIPALTTDEEAGDYTIDTPTVQVKVPPPPPPPEPEPEPVAEAPASSSSSSGATAVAKTQTVQPSANVQAAISGSAIIAEAAKYVGVPYVLGGSTPSGFDCTGFVSYVYRAFGISLPRSSGAYYNVGTRVSDPQPGDLIVSPGHVGIYAGPNLQIDSPRPGKTIQFRPIWQSNPIYVRVTG
ncbi:hypothetical protein Lsed01_00582 [Demequina sediminis]|uniref:NlpC/P60 domain-containing protein n=2 Tax=Demequina sediminis TaxID=1930058 RepID=A0ABP9WHR5_9MICO